MQRCRCATLQRSSSLVRIQGRKQPNLHLCRAEIESSAAKTSEPLPSAASMQEQQLQQQQQQQQQPATTPTAPLLAKGQGTAIITGAISVIFGIAYLVLVQVLDMRGGELQPPPPEAFIP
jgi:hypothetical protein